MKDEIKKIEGQLEGLRIKKYALQQERDLKLEEMFGDYEFNPRLVYLIYEFMEIEDYDRETFKDVFDEFIKIYTESLFGKVDKLSYDHSRIYCDNYVITAIDNEDGILELAVLTI